MLGPGNGHKARTNECGTCLVALLDKGGGELTLFYFTQGGWEGLSDNVALAVVKEEARQISGGGWGTERIPSRGGYEVLRQESARLVPGRERLEQNVCARVWGVGWGGGVVGSGSMGPAEDAEVSAGVGGKLWSSCKSWEISTKYQQ